MIDFILFQITNLYEYQFSKITEITNCTKVSNLIIIITKAIINYVRLFTADIKLNHPNNLSYVLVRKD